MKWFTQIPLKEFESKARITDKFYFSGSCFASEVYDRFSSFRLNTSANSHGIIFHPIPLARALSDVIELKSFTIGDLISHNGIYHYMGAHGKFSSPDPLAVVGQLNESIRTNHTFLQNAEWCIITFGTAAGYRLKANEQWVANCHKLSDQDFKFELAGMDEMFDRCAEAIRSLRAFNPEIRVILSVSPVRYWRQGYRINTLSKSRLHLLVEMLESAFEEIHYFPAYELFMDEMRDYRYYGPDLVHPSPVAVDEVFERLCHMLFEEDSIQAIARIKEIKKRMDHRPIHSDALRQTDLYEALNKEWNALINQV